MLVTPKPPDLLQRLQAFSTFAAIPPAALQWLIHQSSFTCYPKGEALFKPGLAVDHMQIIVEGRYAIRAEQHGQVMELGVFETGYITGVLPFSRMTAAQAWGTALEDTYVLELHRQYFTEMVNQSYELTQALVAHMSDRVRDFTSQRFQNEKLMALGKLSAGLAHELNNPAAAMVRNAQALYQKVHHTPDKFKAIMAMGITPEQTDQVNDLLYAKLKAAPGLQLSILQRENLADGLLDWLEEQGVDEAEDIADTFADFGIAADELSRLQSITGAKALPAVLHWLESTLSLERLVSEIQEASNRISELVKSVKSYSHMDRGVALEAVDVHEGIRSTLTMLRHRIRQKQLTVHEDYYPGLPPLQGFAGELNQVWTNLLVNAIDALPVAGAITVRTFPDREFVRVEFEDNGPGVPEDIQTRIFEPFFTTKPMGEGTGMGLDMARKIVERHRGSIQLSSRPGQTIFQLCFPQHNL